MLILPIDHVIIPVADLAATGAAFEAAGFVVTPEARHSAAMGTANRCIMFDRTYIELMGVVEETSANLPWRRAIKHGSGMGGLAFSTSNIQVTANDFKARCIRTEALRHFSRQTNEGELRFSVIRIDPSETPGFQCLVCEHHTRELLWRPELLRHPNSVTSIEAIFLPSVEGLGRFGQQEGVAVMQGNSGLRLRGSRSASYDLTSSCDITIEVIAP
ncbi:MULTISPECIES: VOC family protein [Agrobacterium]|nr:MULTISPECIES: VOC family protein [Agrobacterium]CUX70121.1 hypothetical protein AGR6A_pAt20048 [Agrobacterium sp. NCPPB 925]